MKTWQELTSLSDAELASTDIVEVNLACAAGLPGSEIIDLPFCLRTVDQWAESVRQYTDRLLPRFQRQPEEFKNSWTYFRALCMITVLQRDLGVRYHPDKKAEDASFDTEDCFLHGIIQGKGGTCGTLPVLYVAVGRRLGYPLKLVSARSHLFVRWQDPGEAHLNIEGTNKGLNCHPDEYYRTGIYKATAEEVKEGCLLKSRTPKEELAGFLSQRGYCWLDLGRHKEASKCFAWASQLAPENKLHACCLVAVLDRWAERLKTKMPSNSPSLRIAFPPRQMPSIPESVERRIVALEVLEDCLMDPGLNPRLHGFKDSVFPPGYPKQIVFDYPPTQLLRKC